MRPLFIFSACDCVPETAVAIQGLIQKGNDEASIFFRMICLMCGKTKKVKQGIDDMEEILASQKSLMEWLDTLPSEPLLKAVIGDALN